MSPPRSLAVRFLPLALLLAVTGSTAAAADSIWSSCSTTANYTKGSTFHSNLNQLLLALTANASSPSTGGFFNITVGQGSSQVYGLAWCHADDSEADCQSCLAGAPADITAACPVAMEAAIMYQGCTLRYSNNSFFGQQDSSVRHSIINGANLTTSEQNGNGFSQSLGNLMDQLRRSITANPKNVAYGNNSINSFQNVYALLQCTQDVDGQVCFACVQWLVNQLPDCCTWKQGARLFALSCYLRFELYMFSLTNYYSLPLPAPPPAPLSPILVYEGSPSYKTEFHATLIALCVAVFLLILIPIWLRCRRRGNKHHRMISLPGGQAYFSMSSALDLEILKIATDNFAERNKLGSGGFGPVYKGELPNGPEVAVKRLARDSTQGLKELQNEVHLLVRLRHKNLVELFGYCIQEKESLLCYEYLPNGSLDKILFEKPTIREQLNWEVRYRIITGICRGLLYLHEESQIKIVHRDLKASNILLDDNMNPKISDFGLARLFGANQTHTDTSRVAGTFGYMAPEYIARGMYSTKSDVFSFGVLVLEIVTGRQNYNISDNSSDVNLVFYAWQQWSKGNIEQLKDPALSNECIEELTRCIHIALLCVQTNPANRPEMVTVNFMFNQPSMAVPALGEPEMLPALGEPEMRSHIN